MKVSLFETLNTSQELIKNVTFDVLDETAVSIKKIMNLKAAFLL